MAQNLSVRTMIEIIVGESTMFKCMACGRVYTVCPPYCYCNGDDETEE